MRNILFKDSNLASENTIILWNLRSEKITTNPKNKHTGAGSVNLQFLQTKSNVLLVLFSTGFIKCSLNLEKYSNNEKNSYHSLQNCILPVLS